MHKEYKPIKFPEDESVHDYIIEWWYFNGHLKDKHGKEYSFMDCFFKVNASKVNIPHILPHMIEDHFKNGEYIHFAHSVISDISNKKCYKEIQDLSLVSSDSFTKEFLYINYRNGNFLENSLESQMIETSPNNFNLKTKHFYINKVSNTQLLLDLL